MSAVKTASTARTAGTAATRAAKACASAAVVAAALTVVAAGPAQAGGPPSGAATPFTGRTEGGSLILKDGDIIACAGVGQLQIAQSNGVIRDTDGAGTTFTTPAGTTVVTLVKGTVNVTVQGITAKVTCGAAGFPTTAAFVPSSSLKGGVKAGSGGSLTGMNTGELVGGGALMAAGLLGAGLLRRRRTTVRTGV